MMEEKDIETGHGRPYALVTGAASGMGRIYAEKLAAMGYGLVLVDINAAGLEETRCIVNGGMSRGTAVQEANGPNAHDIITVVQDLSASDAADRVYEKTSALGCEVEVLVNNAGIMYCQGIVETSEKMLRTIMMVHMNTPLMLCRKYVPAMKERGCGYVLNISSLAAWMIWPGIGMYGVTKRFVRGYSRELRIECAKTGVSVTNAYFGAVDTPLIPLSDRLRTLARALTVMIDPEGCGQGFESYFQEAQGSDAGTFEQNFHACGCNFARLAARRRLPQDQVVYDEGLTVLSVKHL